MADTKVIMPQMGESIFEGTITKWLKKKGDKIQRDEPLFEISTDKIDSEIPSPASGVVQDILVKEGQTVQINTVVAVIGDGTSTPAEAPKEAPKETRKEAAKETAKEAPKASPTEPPKEAPKEVKGTAPIDGPVPETDEEEEGGEEGGPEGTRSSPLVRRIAKERGVDLTALAGKGTGINGRITKRDILSYIEQGQRPVGAGFSRPAPAEAGAYKAPPSQKPAAPSPPPPMKFTGD